MLWLADAEMVLQVCSALVKEILLQYVQITSFQLVSPTFLVLNHQVGWVFFSTSVCLSPLSSLTVKATTLAHVLTEFKKQSLPIKAISTVYIFPCNFFRRVLLTFSVIIFSLVTGKQQRSPCFV